MELNWSSFKLISNIPVSYIRKSKDKAPQFDLPENYVDDKYKLEYYGIYGSPDKSRKLSDPGKNHGEFASLMNGSADTPCMRPIYHENETANNMFRRRRSRKP